MSRLVFVLLLSTAVNAMYTETAQKLNQRVVELFNAGKFSDLVKELFHEDAVFTSTSTGVPATGHAAIEAHLKGSSEKYGQLSGLNVVSASEGEAVVTLNQGENPGNPVALRATGHNVKLTITEKFKDSKFTEVSVNFRKE